MPQCVEISGGTVVVSPDVFPDCTGWAIVEPSHLERLTYWADLAIFLDPSGPNFAPITLAILGLYVTAFGFRVLARQLFNR